MDLSHILNHLGEDRERYFGAVAPPIVQSSIFAFPTVAAMRDGFRDELGHHVYTRGNNPTVAILRKKVAALEGAEDCLMFGSGAAAVSAGAIACVAGGDHVVCVARPYSWTRAVLQDLLGGTCPVRGVGGCREELDDRRERGVVAPVEAGVRGVDAEGRAAEGVHYAAAVGVREAPAAARAEAHLAAVGHRDLPAQLPVHAEVGRQPRGHRQLDRGVGQGRAAEREGDVGAEGEAGAGVVGRAVAD